MNIFGGGWKRIHGGHGREQLLRREEEEDDAEVHGEASLLNCKEYMTPDRRQWPEVMRNVPLDRQTGQQKPDFGVEVGQGPHAAGALRSSGRCKRSSDASPQAVRECSRLRGARAAQESPRPGQLRGFF